MELHDTLPVFLNYLIPLRSLICSSSIISSSCVASWSECNPYLGKGYTTNIMSERVIRKIYPYSTTILPVTYAAVHSDSSGVCVEYAICFTAPQTVALRHLDQMPSDAEFTVSG